MSQTTITEVHEAIKAKLRETFPKVTVDDYNPEPELSVLAPALLLELEEFPMGADVGDDRYPAACRFSVHCVLGWEVKSLALELWEFSAAVAQLIRKSGVWVKGGVLTKPEGLEVYPGSFRKDTQQGYDSRVVTWNQTLYLGESMWNADGITPQEIYLAYAPGGDVPPADEHEKAEYAGAQNS